MKTTTPSSLLLAVATTAAGLFVSTTPSLAQDAAKQDAAPPDEAAMMEAYMKLIAPGPQHQKLKSLVGDWTATQTLWMAPGAPPMENAGTAKFRMIMGGRFLVQNYSSEIPGMGKFQGRGTTGYDKVAEGYIQTWIDSFGTSIMLSKGKATDDRTVEMIGEAQDPLTKKMVGFRTVSKYVSDRVHEMEMFEKHEGADERKIMKIVYKRIESGEKKPQESKKKRQ
jgi:hypothetical protein